MASPLTIQPATKDTYFIEWAPTLNYGSDVALGVVSASIGNYHSILEFAHTIPTNATISSAILSLDAYENAYLCSDPVGRTWWAYRALRTNWDEAQATWNAYSTPILLGAKTSGTTENAANYIYLDRWAAAADGTVNYIWVYGNYNANVKVGLYADSAGEPTTLLSGTGASTAITGATWTLIPLATPVAVVSGTYYWIAINSSATGGHCVYTAGGSKRYVKALTYANAFPNPFGTKDYDWSGSPECTAAVVLSPWTTAGCNGNGTDYTTTDGVGTVVPVAGWITWDIAAQVQTAVTNGIPIEILVRDGTDDSATAYGRYIFSSNYTTNTTLRPKLVITYTAPDAPTVTTTSPVATDITPTTATLNGNITNLNSGGNATIRGFKYGLTEADTWDVHEEDLDPGFGTGAFTLPVTGLTQGTTYHVRAYATNPLGTSYGAWVTFVPSLILALDGASLLKARFPAVRYDGTYNRTYFTWLSSLNSGSIWINYKDHDTNEYGTAVSLATGIGRNVHQAPVVHVIPSGAYAGYILVAYYLGSTGHIYTLKSNSIESIGASSSDWGTAQDLGGNSYPQIVHLGNGNEAIFGTNTDYRISSNGGASWGDATQIVNFGANNWPYHSVVASGNNVYVTWHYFEYGGNAKYNDVYFIYSNDNCATWSKMGTYTPISLPATLSPLTAELVYDHAGTWVMDIQVDSLGSPVITFVDEVDATTCLAKWAHYHDGAWSVHSTGQNTLIHVSGDLMAYNSGIFLDPRDTSHVFIGVRTSTTTSDIQEWHITNANLSDAVLTWAKLTDVTTTSVLINSEAKPVVNYAWDLKLVCSSISSWTNYYTWASSLEGFEGEPPIILFFGSNF